MTSFGQDILKVKTLTRVQLKKIGSNSVGVNLFILSSIIIKDLSIKHVTFFSLAWFVIEINKRVIVKEFIGVFEVCLVVHILLDNIIIVDGVTKFVKEIGTKNDILLTFFVEFIWYQ